MNAPETQQFLTHSEIISAARANLPPGPWSYLMGGAETETTVKRNRHALDTIAFRPRVLRDVSTIDSFDGEAGVCAADGTGAPRHPTTTSRIPVSRGDRLFSAAPALRFAT